MPYNTRRKSLSLPSLGIHVPVTHAARAAAHRASPNHSHGASPTTPATHRQLSPPTTSCSSPALDSISDADSHRPSKKVKRSHGSSSSSANGGVANAATPPPSPKPVRQTSVDMDAYDTALPPVPVDTDIDMDAINDDIVEAVVMQLQATGNRPHLIKELSAILMMDLRAVQQSANPCAIISSRLATFMKRPCWSASSPCPLAKELETVHPRRTYYFLTTCPHLPLPVAASTPFIVPRVTIVTPPLSSAASGSESAEEERRRELSPSPEVDLSSPEFDDVDDDIPMPGTPMGSFSVRFSRVSNNNYVSRSQRGASPPLEKDEKEFTQTAEGLQKRKLAGHTFLLSLASSSTTSSPPSTGSLFLGHGADSDDASRDDSLFGLESRHLAVNNTSTFSIVGSPAMRPTFALAGKKDVDTDSWAKLDTMLDWDRSPENIELDELDGLFDEF